MSRGVAMPGRSMRWRTGSPVYESLIDDDSSPRILHSSVRTIFSRPSYDIVFCMSFLHGGEMEEYFWKKEVDFVKLYKIEIDSDSTRLVDDSNVQEILPSWERLLPYESSFAALGGDIYCLGGETPSEFFNLPYVYMLDTLGPYGWVPLPFMNFPRSRPQSLVLDGNLYIFSGLYGTCDGAYSPIKGGDVEVYHPSDGRWDLLPDPPLPLGSHFICAALENPNRILVASRTVETGGPVFGTKAMFYVYDVLHGYWKVIKNPERKIHRECPMRGRGKALTVGNTLYWISDHYMFVAYLLDHDIWLLGNLACLGLSIFGHSDWYPPILLHLHDKRFCVLQSAPENLVYCVILDVSHNSTQKSMEISVVSVQKYKTEEISTIRNCFLL